MASLQNSVPVQATAPRQNCDAFDMESDLVELADQFGGLVIRNIDEEKVLRHGGPQRAAAKALSEISSGFELLAGEAAAQDRCADVAAARAGAADGCRDDREALRRERAREPQAAA